MVIVTTGSKNSSTVSAHPRKTGSRSFMRKAMSAPMSSGATRQPINNKTRSENACDKKLSAKAMTAAKSRAVTTPAAMQEHLLCVMSK